MDKQSAEFNAGYLAGMDKARASVEEIHLNGGTSVSAVLANLVVLVEQAQMEMGKE